MTKTNSTTKTQRLTSIKTKALNRMVKELCEVEDGKKQMNAGQAREVIKKICHLLHIKRNQEFADAFDTYILAMHRVEHK